MTQRIVFLGDSITDGNTYPLMIREALRAAGKPVPVVINAGIGGDTAEGMSKRLDRDVLPYQPSLVTLSAGINDALRNVSMNDYTARVTAIADRLRDSKIPLLILTTTAYGAKHSEGEKRSGEYNAWLRRFAQERGLKIAEVETLFQKTRQDKGENFILEVDAVHPNWEGQRLIARAVLDALGYAEVAVPQKMHLDVLPGVPRQWRIQVLTEAKPLDEAAAKTLSDAAIANDHAIADWHEYQLPEMQPQEHPWHEQERQRGFALSLDKLLGTGKSYRGLALIENNEKTPKQVWFNTGAQLQDVWLNGQRIYQNKEWHGWHAGRDRIAAQLVPGRNVVLIETAAQFFLSITNDNDW